VTEPAALERAQALARHAAYLGVDRSQFAVTVTIQEAFQLIDWLIGTAKRDGNLNHSLLELDAEQARALGDPWIVLTNFELMGMPVFRAYEIPAEQLQ
jgi:hypothetical protein